MENTTVTVSDSGGLHWPVFIYIVILFVFGLTGNIIILYIYHYRMKKTIFGFFVKVLALVDLTTVLISLPGTVVFRASLHSVDTSRMCKFIIFMNHFTALTAGFLLSVIAVQRYRKVCHPHGKQITRSLAKKLCVGVICLSFCLSVPIVVLVGVTYTRVITNNQTVGVPVCDYEGYLKEDGQSVIYAILVDGEFFGITLLLAVVYSIIGKALKERMKAKERLAPKQTSGKTATKVFFILTVVFIMSVLPLMTISTLFSFFRSPPTMTLLMQTLFDFGVYLPYISTIVNPIVYSFTSKMFRKELMSVFCPQRLLKKDTKTSQTETEDTVDSQTATTSM